MNESNASGEQQEEQADDATQPRDDVSASEDSEQQPDPLAQAQAQADENWNKYLRSVAELENVRKRARRDVENAHKYGIERFAAELLGVSDSLEAALAAGDKADATSLIEGSQATLKLLLTTMGKFGIEQLDPHGEPFDPQQHEAMTMVPSPDVEPNTIIDVIQKGYSLNGRLIRPARVIVAAPAA